MVRASSPNARKVERPAGLVARVAAVAATQHDLITARQLRDLGWSTSVVSGRVRSGYLHPVHRGVYKVGSGALSRKQRWTAAVLAAGPGAALSHLAAAQLHRITRSRGRRIDVVAPKVRSVVGGGHVRVHVARRLRPRDVTIIDGIPVTAVARTLLDLVDVMAPEQIAKCMDEAWFAESLGVPAVRDVLRHNRGRHGLGALEHALRLHESGEAGVASLPELDCLRLVRSAPELGEPRLNLDVRFGVTDLQLDLSWPALRFCIEVDGYIHHLPAKRRRDRERDRTFARHDWIVVRVTDVDLARDRKGALQRIRAGHAQATAKARAVAAP